MTEQKAGHILLADDNDVLREVVQATLEELGYTVYSAADGQQALHTFQAHPIDLALLDVQMPAMDGFTLWAELRKRRPVPVIFISSMRDPEVAHRAVNAGASAFLSKPLYMDDIDYNIQRALQYPA